MLCEDLFGNPVVLGKEKKGRVPETGMADLEKFPRRAAVLPRRGARASPGAVRMGLPDGMGGESVGLRKDCDNLKHECHATPATGFSVMPHIPIRGRSPGRGLGFSSVVTAFFHDCWGSRVSARFGSLIHCLRFSDLPLAIA